MNEMNKFHSYTLKQLREVCAFYGLVTSGNKAALVQRLTEHASADQCARERDEPLVQRVKELEEIVKQLLLRNSQASANKTHTTASDISAQNQTQPRSQSEVTTIEAGAHTANVQPEEMSSLVAVTPTTIPCSACANGREGDSATAGSMYSTANTVSTQANLVHTSSPQTRTQCDLALSAMPSAFQQLTAKSTYANVSDVIAVLPDFHPFAANSLKSDQFIHRISQLKDAYGWNEKLLIFAIQAKLRGPAKTWIDSCEIFTSWAQFVSRFLTDFPCMTNIADIHLEMAETRRTINETLEEYYYKMLSLGRKGNIPESAIIKYILRGINEQEFRKVASSVNYTYTHELLAAIKRYVSLNTVKTPVINKTPINNIFPGIQRNSLPRATPLNEMQNQTTTMPRRRAERHGQLVCYNCFNPGHVSIHCPQPQRRTRCAVCLRTNHATAECPEKKSTSVINKIESAVSVKSKTEIVKNVQVNGFTTCAFVDPGSNRTLVRKTFATSIGQAMPCNIVLTGFAGGQFICRNKVAASLNIDEMVYEVDLLVVNDNYIPEDVLLGRDTLCREGNRVIIQKDECWIESTKKPPNIPPHLTAEETQQLKSVLESHRQSFAENMSELGTCTVSQMEIVLSTNNPISSKPYRVAFSKRHIVRDIISELLENDIVRPSESPYASPVVLVEKQNGEHRLCVDYRKINRVTVKIPFPMPILDEQFAQLAGKKYFTTLDLRLGYHQIQIAESSRKYTAFITTEGHYEYTRMPFGLVNAPAVFQAVMNKIIAKMKPGEVLAYLDDVIIASRTVEEGLHRLNNFLKILKNSGLTLRPDKCTFLATEITHLGHVINEKGIQPGKDWQAVLYYSRHCTETESKYHSYELEVLAVVESLERFRMYILGKPFRLVTDCSAITKARDNKELIPKISRWLMKLMEYDCQLEHRNGSRMAHVDAISRSPDEKGREVEPAGFVMKITAEKTDWLLTMQLQDPNITNIIAALKGEQKSERLKQLNAEYQLQDHRLFRKGTLSPQFVVPKSVRWRIVQSCHDEVGHFGLEKTISRIQENFWFPRMRKYVKEYIAACIECCYHKSRGGKTEGRLHYNNVEPIPFRIIHLDHLGPFIRSKRGMCYVLAISDAFSRYLVVKPVRNTKTAPVLNILNELTGYFGLPQRIVTDRGTAYTSRQFEDYCAHNNIQHVKIAVRTPRANGQVERANQTILSYLRTTTKNVKDWDLTLNNLQWTVNSQKNATSGFSPNELVFDFKLIDLLQNRIVAALTADKKPEAYQVPIYEKRQQAIVNINQERAKWKERFDGKHSEPKLYAVNDLIVVANEAPATGESRKLEPKFRGPYMVTKVLGNDRYVIEDIPGMQLTQRKFTSVYSSDRLKPWCRSPPDLAENDAEDTEETEDGSRSELAELSH